VSERAQLALQLKTGHIRHLQVGDDASAVLNTIRYEKILRGFKRRNRIAQQSNELTDSGPSPDIIVDN
jgi:hypothetical protein